MKNRRGGLRARGLFSFLAGLILFAGLFQFSCGQNKTVDGPTDGNRNVITGTVLPVTCPETGTLDIAMQNSTFIPGAVTAEADTVVKWTNYDGFTSHSVSSDMVPANGSFNSPMISAGQSVCYKFTSPGAYSYHCSDHMQASITIE